MAKQDTKNNQQPEKSPLGENVILHLVVKHDDHRKAYADVLTKVARVTRVTGFRKGKAPTGLVESQVGKEKIIEQVLDIVLPEIYQQAVVDAKISPLVQPSITATSLDEGKDWTFDAATAVAPLVELGDYQAVIKQAAKDFAKEEENKKKDAKTEKVETKKDEDIEAHKQALLGKIFTALIEKVQPKIAPLLLEHEYEHLIGRFAQELAQYKISLDDYLKGSSKNIEDLKNEYTSQALASLQLEFILNAITEQTKPSVTETEVLELLGPNTDKLSHEVLHQRTHEAENILRRRKTIDEILTLAA